MIAVLRNSPKRTGAYVSVPVILAAAYAARFSSYATVGEALFALSGILTAAVALVCGGLALERFRAERRDAFLLVSAGLWVAAVLHLLHFAAYSGVLGSVEAALPAAAILRGTLLPTLFFSLFLVLSLLASRQIRPSAAQPGGVFLAAATLAMIVTVGALVLPVPQASDLVEILGQPFPSLAAQPELFLVAALTIVGIAELLRRGSWRTERFARWLLVALLVTLVALARFPMFHVWPLGATLVFAQGLTLASYVCAIVGIIAGMPARAAAAQATAPAQRPSPVDAAAPPSPSPAEGQLARAPELALLDLQARHRALRNATDGLLIGVRADGIITDWKPAADFGPTATPSELLGKHVSAVLPSDQAEAILAAVAHVLAAGKTDRLRFAAADGSLALEGLVTPHAANQVLCIIRDHTALARALRELDEQRSAAEALRRVTGDWLIRMSRTGFIADLKPPAAAEFAAFAEMFAGKHLQDVFQGDDVAPLVAAAETALAGNTVQELSFLRQSGQVLAVRVTAYGDDTVLCLLRDTTELQELAAQLQESEETNQALRAHLDQLRAEQDVALSRAETSSRVLRELLPDLVLRVRADGTVLEWKPAESFGPRAAATIVNAKVREALPVDLASQIMAAIERAQSDGQPQRFACHPVGGQVLAGGVAGLPEDQYLCVVRDQTQLKQMEAALVQQAAVLAQEIRAKLEEEFLRSLRSENDVLRAHLLRVAQLALEGGGTAPTVTGGTTGTTSPVSAQSQVAGIPAVENSPATEPPPQPQKPAGSSSLPPPPSALQTATRPKFVPDPTRRVDSLADGEAAKRGIATVAADSLQIRAVEESESTSAEAQTAVATQKETMPNPSMTANGQHESEPSTNELPTEQERPS